MIRVPCAERVSPAARFMNRSGSLLFCALLLTGCASRPVSAPLPEAMPPADALTAVVEGWYDEMLALNPLTATFVGDRRYDDQLGDFPGEDHEAAMRALNGRYLDAALALDRARLAQRDQLTLETFLRDRRLDLEAERFPRRTMPISQQGGVPLLLPQLGFGLQPLETVDDYDRWLRRLAHFPAWVDAAIDAMRAGIASGVTQPRVTMERVVPQLDALIVAEPGDSLFFAPVAAMPADFPEAERARLRAAAEKLIVEDLNPAYARLREFVANEYLPAARDTVAWSALPDGEAWYRWLIAVNTTTSMSAEEVHRLGLAEVARIRGEMEDVAREVGFEGDLAAFFRHAQDEPGFYFDEPEALIAGYADIRRRVEEALPRLFKDLPQADFEVRPVESYRARSAAGASYRAASPDGSRPGVFYVNTYNLKAQPRFGMETLFLHEAMPGHHFQGSVQRELTDLPRFRRFGGEVAYGEGWALYAESLGRELGLFTDPMQYYGRLSDEMLRAMRLVVDTGLHAFGWSRERAIQYMTDNSSLAESDIVAEVERYIAGPGQALGYKIGDLRIQAMRRRAEAALGEHFDIREFHAQLLRDGSLPLDVLDDKVDRWIESVGGVRPQPSRDSRSR